MDGRKEMAPSLPEPGLHLTLEAGHTSSHDLIHQQKVGGDDGAAVDHLPLDPGKIMLL